MGMKVEYLAYRDELIEEALSRYAQPRETLSIPYMLKGCCIDWSEQFAAKWPNLKVVKGFWRGQEHAWCVDKDGSIVDPTLAQFVGVGEKADNPNSEHYREVDWEQDEVYLGKCMNCGDAIYGLRAHGQQTICSDSCGASLEAYYNDEISAYRRGGL